MKVLVVDDNAELRQLVVDLLSGRDFVTWVGAAADGFDAVVQTREAQPDVVVLDIEMPVMDGYEALPKILDASPRTRVVVYSAQPSAHAAERLLSLGAAAYLEKTAPIRDLVTAVLELGRDT